MALSVHADCHITENLFPEWEKYIFFLWLRCQKVPQLLAAPTPLVTLTIHIQFFPFRQGMRAAMKRCNTYRDALRRIVLHLSYFIPTWAGVERGGLAVLAAIVQTAVRQDTVEWVKIAPPICATAQTTSMCTLSIRRGCQSQFSGRDGICFIFTRTPSPCRAVQAVITECWYKEQSGVLFTSCQIQTDSHERMFLQLQMSWKNKLQSCYDMEVIHNLILSGFPLFARSHVSVKTNSYLHYCILFKECELRWVQMDLICN